MSPAFRRLSALFLVVLLLTPAAGLRAAPAPARPTAPLDVVINEVAWGGTAASASDEWIELYNNTGAAVDLTGWTLVAIDGSPSITLTGSIPAHGYYLLERTDDNTVKDVPADWIGSFGTGLSNTGESLSLADDLGNVVDTANGDGGAWPAGSPTPNYQSMERIDTSLPDTDANWASNDMIHRNGHDANDNPINGTPKAFNSASLPPVQLPDLAVDKTGPASAAPGDPITYNLALDNVGQADATSVRLTDTLPAGVTFVSQESSYPFVQQGQDIIWTVGTLPAGESGSVLLHAQVDPGAGGNLVNLLTASTPITETGYGNNDASWTTVVGQPSTGEVVINEVAWSGTAASAFDEWIELYNLSANAVDLTGWTLISSDNSPNIVLSGTIPAGGYFLLERTDDNTVSDIAADQIYIGDMSNGGESLTLRDAANTVVDTANGNGGAWPAGSPSPTYQSMERIDASLPDTDANWASNDMVHRNGHDASGNPINGTPKALNSASLPPIQLPDLAVDKAGPAGAAPSDPITYTLLVTNTGAVDATSVVVTDTLPNGVTFSSQESPYSYTQQGQDIVWTVGTLPAGGSGTILLYAQVDPGANGSLVNLIKASTPLTETTYNNNADSWTTVVGQPSAGDVVINEVAWAGTTAEGTDEWVELYNHSASPVDLAGWTLVSFDGSPDIVLSGTVPAYGYFLLERTDDNAVIDVTADQTYTGGLVDTGEILFLRDGTGAVVDTANGDGGVWPAGSPDPNFQSMERIGALQSDSDANWASNDMIHRNGHDIEGNPINGTPKAENSASLPPPLLPDLEVVKTGPLSATVGTAITYSLVVNNMGTMDAPLVVVTDTLPAGVTFSSQASPYPYTQQGQNVVWSVGALPTGTLAAITLRAQVGINANGSLVNMLSAATTLTETDYGNNQAAWTTVVGQPSTGTVAINEVAWSGTAASSYDEWIELYNPSPIPVDLSGWRLADGGDIDIALTGILAGGEYFLLERGDDNTVSDVPAGQIYVGNLNNTGEVLTLTNSQGDIVDTANAENGGSWPAGTDSTHLYRSMERISALLPDADANWASNDMVHRNGLDANGAPINGTPGGPNSVSLPAPDLAVEKTGPLTATAGVAITYTLHISNDGGSDAPSVVVTDTLPYGIAFIAQESPYSYTRQGQDVVWSLGTLATGAGTTIVVHGQVQESAPLQLLNTLSASTPVTETTLLNNSDSWATTVEGVYCVALPAIFKNYEWPVLVSAVLYDGYQTGDTDEAVQIYNLGALPIELGNFELCKDTTPGLNCKLLPADTVPPRTSVWVARDAAGFAASFGFAPDYVPADWLSGGLANDGDEVILRENGQIVDVVVYESSLYSGPGWSGPALEPYHGSGNFGSEGQILFRSLDEKTGRPWTDTNTAAGWFQNPADPEHGRRVVYPGWDLESFYQPLAATEQASMTVGIAPDNAYQVLHSAIARAQHSIEAEMYEVTHYGVVEELAARAQDGISVTLLLEGTPAGGIKDQELWACQQLEAAGGRCYFMYVSDTLSIFDRYTFVHSKFMLIDRQWAVVSSQNPTGGGMPDDDKSDGTWGSRGIIILTDAPSVVGRLGEIWDADFDPLHHNDVVRWGNYGYGGPPPGFVPDVSSGGITDTVSFPNPLVTSGETGFEVISSPESSLRQTDSLIGLVDRAGPGDTVEVEQMYEYPDWGTLPDDTIAPNLRLQAYIDAARRGARVRILLNSGSFGLDYSDISKSADALNYVNSLAYCEGLDLQAHLGDPTEYGIHNKLVLARIGGVGYAHIGSINGSETSSKINREIALQLRSDAVHDYLLQMFDLDWSVSAHLLVDEVMYNPLGGTDDAGREWVELFNPTDQPIDLTGWTIGDALSPGEYGSGLYYFPAGAVIPPHSFVTIAELAQMVDFEPTFEFLVPDPSLDDPTVPNMVPVTHWDGFGFALSNSGDEVILRDPYGQAVDAVTYGDGFFPGTHPYVSDISAGHSLERIPPERDTDYCNADLNDTQFPTPGVGPAGYRECGR